MRKETFVEAPVFDPTPEEIAAVRAYWAEQDRIAEFEAWYVAQAENQEHEYSSECECDQCHETYDEYQAQGREYERAIRGY